jgi:hypothetical protein
MGGFDAMTLDKAEWSPNWVDHENTQMRSYDNHGKSQAALSAQHCMPGRSASRTPATLSARHYYSGTKTRTQTRPADDIP